MEFFLGAFEQDWERRRAAILHERSIGKRSLEEEELRRRGGSFGAEAGTGGGGGGGTWKAGSSIGRARAPMAEPSMRARFQGLASGSQPAVVKLTSFGGGGRLGAMINYVSRTGSVAVENERGEQLRGRDALSTVGSEWDHLMGNRAESRDIGTFTMTIGAEQASGSEPYDLAGGLLKRALGDRSSVFTCDRNHTDGSVTVNGVVVLRDSAGERLTADRKASDIVEARLAQDREAGSGVAFRFTGHGNGVDYGTSRVRALVERSGNIVQTESGRAIEDVTQAGDLVQLEWRGKLHSRKPRDVMHLIMSARAGTDVEAFQSAARDLLADRFAGHRYVFSMHDPVQDPKSEETGGKRPHVHVHAIVAMRSDAGDRIETTIRTFREWRMAMAENARAHGIDMEMTDRRDRASAPAYTKNQVRPTSHAGRTEHEGTSTAADARYRGKRDDSVAAPRTKRSVDYSEDARKVWADLASGVHAKDPGHHIGAQVLRLERARSEHDPFHGGEHEAKVSGSHYRTSIVILSRMISEAEDVRQMTREEFTAYEKQVNFALLNARQIMPESEKASFEEIASAARDHVDARRELIANAEQVDSRAPSPEREAAQDPDAQWARAVAQYGLWAVEAANEVMLAIEHFRGQIGYLEAGNAEADKSRLQASLNIELARAGELGIQGNGLIREIAERDHDLRTAIETSEWSRDHLARSMSEGGGVIAGSHDKDAQQRDRGKPPVGDLHSAALKMRQEENELMKQGVEIRRDMSPQRTPKLERLQPSDEHEQEDRDR